MTKNEEPKPKTTVINVPEAVGVFDKFEDFQAAFYDLRMVGFSRHDISLLAKQNVLEEKLGKAYWRASDLEDNPDAPRAAFVSEEAIGELEGAIAGGFFFWVLMLQWRRCLPLPAHLQRPLRPSQSAAVRR